MTCQACHRNSAELSHDGQRYYWQCRECGHTWVTGEREVRRHVDPKE